MGIVVGRDRELATVENFLKATGSAPGALVIEGDAGIGKTTVWREGLERAAAQGFEVLGCRPVEAETKLSYASIADLLGGVGEKLLADLPEPQSRALAVALLEEEPDESPPDQRAIGTAVATLLARLAERTPVIVAVDDVQWLDRPSAAALAFAARRLGSSPVGFLLVRRTGALDSGIASTLEHSLSADLTHVRLEGVSVASLFHIVQDQFGESLPRPALLKIERFSGGNPLYALELARALIDSGSASGEPLPVPDTLAGLVAEHLAGLPAATMDALLVAAAASSPRISLVESVLGEDPRKRLVAAEAAGVVEIEGDRIRFTHPLFASAVYSAAGAETRRRRHRELAEIVRDPEERARHLALSAPEPADDVAAALDVAAARAGARGAPGAAAELAELAARLTPAEDQTAMRARTLASAQSLASAGDPERARELVEQILIEPLAPAERGDALRLLGEIRYHEDSIPDAVRLFEEALAHIEDPAVAIPVRLDLALASVSSGEVGTALEHTRQALEDAESVADPPLLADALGVAAIVDFMAGLGTERPKLERALELEDRRRPTNLMLRPSSIAAMIAVYEGHLTEACDRLYELRVWAFERGEDAALPFLLDHVAWAEWWRGDFAAADRAAEEALELSAQTGSKTNRTAPLVHRAMVRGFHGEVKAAFDDLSAATKLFQETGWTFGLSWALTASGSIHIALGDTASAAEALEPLVGAAEATGIGEPIWVFFVPDAVEALSGVGQGERAEALLDAFEAQARRLNRSWALAEVSRCRALLLAEHGELDGALAAAEDALARQELLELPVGRGRALLTLGRVRRRRREKLLAKEALEAAQELFDGLGATLWGAQARSELGRVGLRRGSPSKLTETERRVAELAAEGRTTKEVARLLSVSPKTVEASLSRIYGKLEIHSRAELGAWMARRSARSKT